MGKRLSLLDVLDTILMVKMEVTMQPAEAEGLENRMHDHHLLKSNSKQSVGALQHAEPENGQRLCGGSRDEQLMQGPQR